MKSQLKLALTALVLASLFLVGCGDDGGSSSAPSNADQIVATYEDLTLCTANREGASAYVRDEKTEYVCTGGDWIPASDALSSATGNSASSDSTAYDDIPVVAVKNKTISGSAQKGPFVNGASVTVQELDGKTLGQTGKSFKGKIAGDKGEFSISSVTLASQYALLEATGYYMNENTGAKSNGTITLNALVDLSKRENVNINLLTHLEYERALYLTTTGMNVPAEKKQAEKEIFEAFGITGDFANSEELNILSTSEGDAALLAISVLMQSNLTEANLSERLANFASDIEKDGKWDDDTIKAKIADWASTANLERISANVKAMNANGKVPAFEQAVKNFWWNNFGLGRCSAKNSGEIKEDTNSLSSYHGVCKQDTTSCQNLYPFICDTAIANWRHATAMEYDVYPYLCTVVGTTITGTVTATPYCCTENGWASLLGWNWDVPKEVRLNPNIPYGTMTDNRDGRTYKTVVIGSQIWMAENLNFDYKVAGTSYGNWCYNDSAKYCSVTGRLYTWGAAMDSAITGCGYDKLCDADTGRVTGVCPNGWHLPSQAEWDALFTAVGGRSTAGTALKITSGWHTGWNNIGNGTDEFGFSAFPSGYKSLNDFINEAYTANFWSSSEVDTYGATRMLLEYSAAYADVMDYSHKGLGFAVRCLSDSSSSVEAFQTYDCEVFLEWSKGVRPSMYDDGLAFYEVDGVSRVFRCVDESVCASVAPGTNMSVWQEMGLCR